MFFLKNLFKPLYILQLHRLRRSDQGYQQGQEGEVEKLPLSTVSAMFYDTASKKLNIVSGAFIYIFTEHQKLQSAQCTIVPFARYFNCTEQYYTKDTELGNSWKAYAKQIEQNHQGQLAFGNCRLESNFKWTNLNNSVSDSDGGFVPSTAILFGTVGVVVCIFVIILFVFAICFGKSRGANSKVSFK